MNEGTGYSPKASSVFSFRLLHSIAWHWKTLILIAQCTSTGEGHMVRDSGHALLLESKSDPHSSPKVMSRQQPIKHSYKLISFSLNKSRGIPCGKLSPSSSCWQYMCPV